MENQRNVILINEDILTQDIMKISKTLKETTDTLRKLKSGIREQKFLDTIKKLDDIEYALRKLGEKDFNQFIASTVLLNN